MEHFLAGVERRAYRIALFATRQTDDALDLVQEAMTRLVERYAQHPHSEWTPLFYRILTSQIRDWQRRNAVRRRWRVWLGKADDADDHTDPLEQVGDVNGTDPADQVAQHGALTRLEQALHALPARQREAFLLRAWEGLDVAQTARAMGCSAGSVKTHYSRAVHSLRATLAEHWS